MLKYYKLIINKNMNNKKRNLTSIIIVCALVIIVIGLSVWQKAISPRGDIKVAYVSSLSGDAGVWGQSLQKGFDFALNEINAKGGINGRKITAVYEDDKCDAATGVTAFNKVIGIDGVKYITGTVCSSVAMSVEKNTQANGVFYVASGATDPEVTKQGNGLVFRPWASDAYDAQEVGRDLISTFGLKKVSVISMSDIPSGEAIKNTFKDAVVANGGQVVSEEMVVSTNKDIKTSVMKLIDSSPEGVYIASLPDQTVLIISQLKALGYKGKIFVYSASAASEGFATKVKNKDSVFYVFPVTNQETNFWNDYKTQTGTNADLLVALGYDSMNMIADGIKSCGENNTCIRDYFINVENYQMSRGKVSFDKYGDVSGLKYEIKAL